MAEPQIRLIYTSTFNPDITDRDISALVGKAAAFNQQHGITGVLAVEDRRVCQILEGPAEAVRALYASIRKDARHSAVNELDQSEIAKPHFDAWGMVRRPMADMVMLAFRL